MNRCYVEKVFQETSLKNYWTRIEPLIRKDIEVDLTPETEETIEIGCSKLGGRPDLPPTVEWPTEPSSASLSFIGQVNLAEVTSFDQDKLLPSQGWLWFFYSIDQPWGFDPHDAGKFKVLFNDGPAEQLRRLDYPDDVTEDVRFSPSRMGFLESVSLPSWENDTIRQIIDQEEAKDEYFDLTCADRETKLLGYADNIQGEMERECALVTHGLYCGNSSGYQDPRAAEFGKEQDQWQLLFQVGSHEKAGMMWGDGGRLYYWIKKADLKKRDFSQCWVILQCG